MTQFLFDPLPPVSVGVGGGDTRFPVRRIFCIGRNYAEHVREMGGDPDRDEPCYFTKSSHSLAESGSSIPYPPGTHDCHHEVELVVAIGRSGFEVAVDDALGLVYGYAVGLDMTRRDLQLASRNNKGPWDTGKDFDNSAVIGTIAAADDIGHPSSGRIHLAVNGELKQDSDLSHLIWSVPEIIAQLSCLYRLEPGDLIYTGTPDGVGPVRAGDRLIGGIDGVGTIELTIAD